LILKKIIKIVATRWQILRLKCTKSLQRSPRPPSWILGGLLLREGRGREGRGRRGKGRERRGKGEGREGEGREGREEGRGPPAFPLHPSRYILDKGLTGGLNDIMQNEVKRGRDGVK